MKNLRYWMIFQVILGVWLILSPVALGFRKVTSMTINDLILGAIVTILGLAVALTRLPRVKHLGSM